MAYNFQTWFPLTIHTIQFVSQLHNFTSFNQQSAIHRPPSQPLLWLLHHFSVLPGVRSNVSTSHPFHPFTLSLNHRRRKSRAAPPRLPSFHTSMTFAWPQRELKHISLRHPGDLVKLNLRKQPALLRAAVQGGDGSLIWLLSFVGHPQPQSEVDTSCVLTTSLVLWLFFGEKNVLPFWSPKKTIRSFHQRRSCTRASLCDFQSCRLTAANCSRAGLAPTALWTRNLLKRRYKAWAKTNEVHLCTWLKSQKKQSESVQFFFLPPEYPSKINFWTLAWTGFQVIFEPLPNDIKVTSRGCPIYWTFEFARPHREFASRAQLRSNLANKALHMAGHVARLNFEDVGMW